MPTLPAGPNTLGVLQAMQTILGNEVLVGGVSPFTALSSADATRYGVARAIFIGKPKDFKDGYLPQCNLWAPPGQERAQQLTFVGYPGRVFDELAVVLQCFVDLCTDWYAGEQKILQIRDALWPRKRPNDGSGRGRGVRRGAGRRGVVQWRHDTNTPGTRGKRQMAMRLGLNLGYWGSGPAGGVALAQEAERLGFDSVWTAEAYGSDAVTPLTWVGALTSRIKLGTGILQMPARTPAMTAMTAATLDLLSGGRALLGLGLSGPQVVEGWHGQPYGKPLARTREYVEIVRRIWAREAPLDFKGMEYQIPIEGGTGLGKPLKLIIHPLRPHIPIYLAAIGPRNIELAGEIADGWLPIFFSPAKEQAYLAPLEAGLAKRQSSEPFDIAATVTIVLGDDVQACRDFIKPMLALYIGGMGARGKNFYNDLACRYGYEGAAYQVQDLYLAGHRSEAAAAVPDALVDEVALCGPRERIAELLEPWKASRVTTLICATMQPEALQMMAELVGA